MKKSIKKIIISIISIIGIVSISMICSASKTNPLPKDSLIADFKFFCRMIEETHPDPYTRFGGRPYFYMQRDKFVDRIAQDSLLDLSSFSEILNEFIIPLKDMHTWVEYPSPTDNSTVRYAQRISFIPFSEGLMVSGISKPNEHLLGSKLLSIGEVPIDSLAIRMLKISSSENNIGNLKNLAMRANQNNFLQRLGVNFTDSVSYGLITHNRDTVYVNLPLVQRHHLFDVIKTVMNSSLQLPDKNLQYAFIDDEDNIMYLKLSSVMARENYKYCYENGWANAEKNIENHYKQRGERMPENMEKALTGIPSFSETFSSLLESMKNNDSDYLIIDLRGNGGGWTPITFPSLIMMYGDDYIYKDLGDKYIHHISDLYLQKVNMDIHELNKSWGTQFEIGDYYSDKEEKDDDINKERNKVIQNAMTETRDLLKSLNGKPLYKPKQIFVITDANTFSAAFHYAYFLWKMGATIVGIPSSQSTNAFMETTPFQLPYTKLSASSSNLIQQLVPVGNRMENALIPEIEITMDDYYNYNLDENTPILKIMDIISGNKK